MLHPMITIKFENEILELIDNQDKFTRSDLQGKVEVIVNNIMAAGKELPADVHPWKKQNF